MPAAFIITFRETLEIALIVGIILSYLLKTGRQKYNAVVYLGIVSALVASILFALGFEFLLGGFSGVSEQIFEGAVMFLAAILLTYMILWMLKQRHISQELKEKVDKHIIATRRKGLFLLVFLSVLREGVETVIFLAAAASATRSELVSALLGIIAALVRGYAIYVLGKQVNIKLFFNITSIFLILFAAGLVAHGVHEFQEAGVIPIITEHVWDSNPVVSEQNAAAGVYPFLHENGTGGELLKGLFGYNGNPSLIEVLSYVAYLLLILLLYLNLDRIHRII